MKLNGLYLEFYDKAAPLNNEAHKCLENAISQNSALDENEQKFAI